MKNLQPQQEFTEYFEFTSIAEEVQQDMEAIKENDSFYVEIQTAIKSLLLNTL